MNIDDLKYIDQQPSKLKRIKIKTKGKRRVFDDVLDGVSYQIVSYLYKGECYVDTVKSVVMA